MKNNSISSHGGLSPLHEDTTIIPEFKGINPEIYRNTFSANPNWSSYRNINASFYIRYSDLSGITIHYKNPDKDPLVQDSKREFLEFNRYRLKEAKGKQKYSQPAHSPQLPFLTGLFDFRDIIDWTLPLIMVEGEKKAYVLCSKGIPAIGLSGINGFYRFDADDQKYKIAPGYDDIPGLLELLKTHMPGLVLLHDSDALEGSRQRKNNFFSCIKAFSLLFQGTPRRYAMVKPTLGAKGIDDAFLAYPEDKFNNLANSFPLNNSDDLAAIRALFIPNVGKRNWDTLSKVMNDLDVTFRWNTRKFLLQYSKHGEQWKTIGNLDADICRLMQLEGVEIGTAKLNEMIRSTAIAEQYDPVISFFNLLPEWDGNDYISQLFEHILLPPDEDPHYFQSMFKKHLIRSVRCAIDSTYANRYVLVLHGDQGIGKTEFWRWLTPFDLYYEETINPANKDSEFPLAAYLIINLDDLDELGKRDVAHLKSYISKFCVKQRPPYGRNIEEYFRIANFVGSTNRSDILSDEVNTRWLILKVSSFNWQNYTKEFDPVNIWSQAYAIYKLQHEAGEISEDEKRTQAGRNSDFLENSLERELLLKYIEKGEDPHTLSSILSFLTKHESHKLNANSLSRELKRLLGEPLNKRENGIKGRYYYIKLKKVVQVDLDMPWV